MEGQVANAALLAKLPEQNPDPLFDLITTYAIDP
jgi:hypothetical protein